MVRVRAPKFAGSFYPSGKEQISRMVKEYTDAADVPAKAVSEARSYVAPHAGYIYSGSTAAYTYKALSLNSRLKEIETIVVIGPNHTGFGDPISVSLEDWKTPVGISENDKELSKMICGFSDYISINEDAHAEEHSIEVQLPFLQFVAPGKRLCMICMGDQDLKASEILSSAILKAAEKVKRNITVVASSDFDHYESAEVARKKDTPLHEAISKLDHARFNGLVHSLEDTACGYGPITVAMLFAEGMHASKGTILKYSNSGDQTGDYSSVVAYSSIAFV
jgi:AmmeMemoRadiSam system protein B